MRIFLHRWFLTKTGQLVRVFRVVLCLGYRGGKVT